MNTKNTAGGAGNDREELSEDAATAEAMMANLDDEVGYLEDSGESADTDTDNAGGDNAGGDDENAGPGGEDAAAGDEDAGGEGQEQQGGDAGEGAGESDQTGDEKPADKEKPEVEGDEEEEDEKAPEDAKRWHPAARKHIDKILTEKKKLRDQLRQERSAIDDLHKLTQSVGLPAEHLPDFVAVAGKALLKGDPQAMATVAEALTKRGYQFAAPEVQKPSGFSDAEMAEVAKVAAEAALEDFDAAEAAKKAVAAVRQRRKDQQAEPGGGEGERQQQQSQGDQQQHQQTQQEAVPEAVRQAVDQLGAEALKQYGDQGPRVVGAMRKAIQEGCLEGVPPQQWPRILTMARDAEAARVQAEKAAEQRKKPPKPTTTSPTGGPKKPKTPFADLDAEVGV